jgi:hypothetical protein
MPSQASPVPEYGLPSTWPVGRVLGGLAFVFVLQVLFLPCMCAKGSLKMSSGILLDLLFLLRLLLAMVRGERTNDWTWYLVLLAASPVWIPVVMGE